MFLKNLEMKVPLGLCTGVVHRSKGFHILPRDTCVSMSIAALVTIMKWIQPRCLDTGEQ